MINQISLRVSDVKKSKAFYAAALAPLGYRLLKDREKSAGFGIEDKDGYNIEAVFDKPV